MDRLSDLAMASDQIARALAPQIANVGRIQINCDRHGPFLATVTRLRSRDVYGACPGCAAEREAERVAQAEETRRVALQAAYEEKLGMTAIPRRFIGKTLENFHADTEAKRYALTVARDFVENFDRHLKRGDGLVLSGMPGTGKSHIAGAILQAILPKHVGVYTTCMGAIRAIRETWRKDSERSEREVLDILGDAPLLVLDEIGVQYGTDGEQTVIFDILDRRYRDMRPTLLLTNQDKAGLKQFIGERAYDRLTETSRWVPFDWPSYRPQARKEAA